jgi:hypothetical protein
LCDIGHREEGGNAVDIEKGLETVSLWASILGAVAGRSVQPHELESQNSHIGVGKTHDHGQ